MVVASLINATNTLFALGITTGVAVAPLLGFGWDFIIIFSTVASVSAMFAIMVFSPLMFLWLLTVLEWWRGVTN